MMITIYLIAKQYYKIKIYRHCEHEPDYKHFTK